MIVANILPTIVLIIVFGMIYHWDEIEETFGLKK